MDIIPDNLLLFRKIASGLEYISEQCMKSLADFSYFPNMEVMNLILSDEQLINLSKQSCSEDNFIKESTFIIQNYNNRKARIAGYYYKYVNRLVNDVENKFLSIF